jgi:hypothetical protein
VSFVSLWLKSGLRRPLLSSTHMPDPQNAPMGRLDAFDVGPKKLTVQTEFFGRPNWRIETKVYLAGALKKVYNEDLSAMPENELQRFIDTFHRAKMDEIAAGLRKLQQ